MLKCKPCLPPHNTSDMPRQLPLGFSQFVLTEYAAKTPSYHMTVEDADGPLGRVMVRHISGRQLVQDRGGKIAVIYQTQ